MNIQHISPCDILVHKLLENMPQLGAGSEEMQRLVLSVSERGIDQPLIVCTPQGKDSSFVWLLDGRHRLRAALEAGLESVPVIVRDDIEPIQVVISSLCERRHLTKSAMAYLLYPAIQRSVQKGAGRPSNKSSAQRTISEEDGSKSSQGTLKSAHQLSDEAGFGRNTYFQAAELHELLDMQPHKRGEAERKLLEEGEGLGNVIKAVKGGFMSPEGAELTDKRAQHDRLALEFFSKTTNQLLSGWERFDARQRMAVKRSLIDEATKWPDELREDLAAALSRKARRSE